MPRFRAAPGPLAERPPKRPGIPPLFTPLGAVKFRIGTGPPDCRRRGIDRRRVGLGQGNFLHGAVIVESHQTGFFINLNDFNFVLPLAFAEDVGLVLGRLSGLAVPATLNNTCHCPKMDMMPLGVILGRSACVALVSTGWGGFRPKTLRTTIGA